MYKRLSIKFSRLTYSVIRSMISGLSGVSRTNVFSVDLQVVLLSGGSSWSLSCLSLTIGGGGLNVSSFSRPIFSNFNSSTSLSLNMMLWSFRRFESLNFGWYLPLFLLILLLLLSTIFFSLHDNWLNDPSSSSLLT